MAGRARDGCAASRSGRSCPGHGPAGGREAVEDQIGYFDAAERTVREAAEFGFDPVAALKAAFPDRLLAVVLPDVVKAFAPR